jgi:histone H3/H4
VISAAPAPAPASAVALKDGVEREILIVVSKMKKYIKDRSGMNTSDAVAEMLSDHVRAICDEAIRIAGADNRKTVLDRDVPKPIRR